MTISIETTVNNGHLILYLINSNGVKIMTLRDNANNSCMLVPGQTYRFEWHVWSNQEANYTIKAAVEPSVNGFPPLNWQREYNSPHNDMGGFYFSV